MHAASRCITIPVEGHVFSTAKELHHAPYDPVKGYVDLRPAFDKPVAETVIYGFADHRVSVCREDPTQIRINALYANQEKIDKISYYITPKCGKVEFETWRSGYILLPKSK